MISSLSLHQSNQFDHARWYFDVVDFALAAITTSGRDTASSLILSSFTFATVDHIEPKILIWRKPNAEDWLLWF